jgi:DNA invertase Pin-like site-specific DNA recombinase
MKTCLGYIRVSTAKQGELGVSLQAQREAITRYADRGGYHIAQWFEERETAAKRGRPLFNEMLRLLRTRRADGLIIHKIDRSARNLKDWSDLGELIDSGVEVHFAGDSLDLHTRGGRLSADIQAVVAADYIRNLREEAKKGLYGRLKQGLYPFGAPTGYLNRGKGQPKDLDPVMSPLVRKVFELYATGRYNLNGLVQEANRLGLRTRGGGKITVHRLSYTLNNPFYIGLMRIKATGETFPGVHKPLIPKSLFDHVQRILRGKTNTRVIKHDFLFRRMVTCGTCGRTLIGERQKGNVYYRCQTRTCKGVCVREEAIEGAMKQELESIQLDEREISYVRALVEHIKQDWAARKEDQETGMKLLLGQLTERLDRLVDAFLDGNLEKDIYEERKRRILLERIETEEKLAGLKAESTSGAEKVIDFLELAKTALLRYELGTPEEKRDLAKLLFSNRVVTGKNVSTRLSFPYSEIAKRPKFSRGAPQRIIPRTFRVFLDRVIQGILAQGAQTE